MTDDARWQPVVALQAATAHSAWLGLRLMLAYQILQLTDSAIMVGVQSAVFAAAGLLVAIPAGRLADRWGSARLCGAGLLVSLAGALVAVLWWHSAGSLLAALLIGLGHMLLIVGQQTLVARLSPSAESDAAFGMLMASTSIGQLVGPLLVTVAASVATASGAPLNVTVGLLVGLALLTLSIVTNVVLHRVEGFSRHSPDGPASEEQTIWSIAQNPGVTRAVLAGSGIVAAGDLLSTFLPLWAIENDVAAWAVGLLLAVRASAATVSRFGMGWLVERIGRYRLIEASLVLAVAGLLILPSCNEYGAIPIMIVLGLGLGLPQPLTLAWVTSLVRSRSRGAVLGARMAANRTAQVIAPLAIGAAAGSGGARSVFYASSGLLVACLILIVTRDRTTS